MIRTGGHIAVRNELEEAVSGDEAEGWEGVVLGVIRMITHTESCQGYREWIRVVDFKPVVPVKDIAFGHPFVDNQGSGIPGRLLDVRGTRGGDVEGPLVTATISADGETGDLRTEFDGVEQAPAAGLGIKQIDTFSGSAERKLKMDARSAVGIVGEEDKEIAGGEGSSRGEGELVGRVGVVGEAHSGKIHGR